MLPVKHRNYTDYSVLISAGLEPELMSSLACQFMDVMYIPKELDDILREKSHGVPSWCEQLTKDILLNKIIQIVPESKAFEDECLLEAESASFGPLDDMRDKYFELSSQTGSYDSRPDSPFLRSKTPALPNLIEDDDDEEDEFMVNTKEANVQKDSLFTKLMTNEDTGQKRKRSDSAASNIATRNETPKFEGSRRSSLPNEGLSVKFETPGPIKPESLVLSRDDIAMQNGTPRLEGIRRSKPESFGLSRDDFVPASTNAMPRNTYSVCIVAAGVKLSNVVIPDSVKDMVLARVDRMSPMEQVTLKCATILGMQFARDLVEALVPMTCKKSLDVILYTLVRDGILECASLASQHQSAHNHHGFYDYNDPAHAHHHAHHHQHHHHHNVATSLHAPVLCGCYAGEGNKVRYLGYYIIIVILRLLHGCAKFPIHCLSAEP